MFREDTALRNFPSDVVRECSVVVFESILSRLGHFEPRFHQVDARKVRRIKVGSGATGWYANLCAWRANL